VLIDNVTVGQFNFKNIHMIEKNPGITIYKATDKSVNVVFNSEISKKIENSVIFDFHNLSFRLPTLDTKKCTNLYSTGNQKKFTKTLTLESPENLIGEYEIEEDNQIFKLYKITEHE
jgi:hypothetical protein